ncbi:MAG TPA: 16S rRNA (adenine(1518)-N(6)/adenine(1519)-N(6))-dimethyltransferase RsmA [Dehalococcoidales bacterium]|nr:16S rRNA (adenine(1518)-N(6)/adenine(1519)-N(6))-dimethyltransferase RsmA [Dehalococcoidales bacterium]
MGIESESLLPQTRRLLRRCGLQARKRLGQHFLVDEDVLKLIISTAELTPNDVVLEIGPGLGVLTRELVRQAGWVIAIELDSKLAATLGQTLASFNNVTVINENVLKIDPGTLLREQSAKFPPIIDRPYSYKVVANLPYYITSPVLRHFLEASVKPQVMVVMVQKEVAEAIVAEPGGMSVLSVSVQFYGKPELVSYVPARCFYPVPEVDSAILRIDLHPEPTVAVADEKSFFELVRAGFTTPRKQICNSLAQGLGLPKADILSLLEKANVVPQRRAETLTLNEWAKLWQIFTRVKEYANSASTG